MPTRDIESYPCNDACCEVMTDETVEGAPVYRCPGCDSTWIELNERTEPAVVEPTRPTAVDPTHPTVVEPVETTSTPARPEEQ